jgi:hypothetical protein
VRAIKCLFSGVLTLILLMQQALAIFPFEKKVVDLSDYINEEIYIDRLFQASDGVYKLNIAILIPQGLDIFTVTVIYDQLKQKKIKDIAWIKATNKSNKIFNFFNRNKNKKAEFERIFPFKKEDFFKDNYEFDNSSPDISYDRVSEQKFIVYKRYNFYQNEIFGSGKKKFDHLLEFHFEDGSSRAIRIRNELYRDERYTPEEKFLPTMFGKGVKPDPRYAPNPVLPKEARNEANDKYNNFLERQNEVIKTRNQEAYEKTMQELENSYGRGEIPDYDGLYRDK